MPNSSNSKMVFSSPSAVGVEDLTPRRLCRTPANVLLSSPNSFVKLRQPGEAQGVVPIGVDLLEVVADVEHREAIDLEARLRRLGYVTVCLAA